MSILFFILCNLPLVVFTTDTTTLLFQTPINLTIKYIHSVENVLVIEKLHINSTGIYIVSAEYGGACGYGIPCTLGDFTPRNIGFRFSMYCDVVNHCRVETPVGDVDVVGVFSIFTWPPRAGYG